MVKEEIRYDCEVPYNFCTLCGQGYHETELEAEKCYNSYQEALEKISKMRAVADKIHTFFTDLMQKHQLTTKDSCVVYDVDYDDSVEAKVKEGRHPELGIYTTLRFK